MKKKFLSAFLAGTILTGLAAGAAAQQLVTTDRVGSPDAPNVLTMRANPTQSPNSPSAEQKATFEKVWQSFAEAHPDWQVQFEFFGQDIGSEHARLLEQARAGRAPDCVTVDSFQLALFIKNGVLQPLDDFFSQEEIDDLFPFIRDGITGSDGHIYAWWWGTDLRVLYRNTEIVADTPETWEELQNAALEAAESGVEGVLFNGGRWEGTTFDWLANFWAQGGSLVDEDGKPIFGEGENREKMLRAMDYFKGLVDSGAAPRRVATIKDYNDFNAAAIAGSAAMFFGGHWQHFQLQEAMPEEAFAKWDVSELPGPTAGERATGTGGWTVAAFTDDPAKVEMCANLMREVYMGPANEVIGDLPTRESLFAELPKFQDPYFDKLKDYLVNGRARPGVPIYPEISNQIQITMGEVLSGTKEPEAALDGAWNRVMEAYTKM
ncbi:extracellular solute-binding protein [Chelativorans alearense]|uniref:extracellular solute-binding protein n=1 Tax=Chelativorans alearense TaxID=2681495 RepID=UPI0013D60E57|nr:extracellular solute-binding protein [Chelativorans alearense]